MNVLHRALLILLTWTCVAGSAALAQDELTISGLTYIDKQYMQQQRTQLNELAGRYFGRQFNGSRDNDLALLQRLLDDEVVRADQTQQLQGMGIIMGDLLAQDLGLHWVVYQDRMGRSRALRYQETDNYLFPTTMIARRREVGNTTAVVEIYNKAEQTMRAAIPPLPFQ